MLHNEQRAWSWEPRIKSNLLPSRIEIPSSISLRSLYLSVKFPKLVWLWPNNIFEYRLCIHALYRDITNEIVCLAPLATWFDIFLIDKIHTAWIEWQNGIGNREWCMGYGFIRIIYFSICINWIDSFCIEHTEPTIFPTANIQYSTLPSSQTNRREICIGK